MSSFPKAPPGIYSLEDIEKAISEPEFAKELIDGIKKGFVLFAADEFYSAPIQTLGLSPYSFTIPTVDGYAAQTCVKSGYFKGHEHYVIKVASGGYPIPSKCASCPL